MKKMNKKGFTLIELLAVIVVLAIVMVIATQKITDVVNNSRANAFISSYKSIIKQVKTNIVADPDSIACKDTNECKSLYDISTNDYGLSVVLTNDTYNVHLTVTSSGKFKNLDLTRYGDAAGKDQSGKTICVASKIDNTVTNCSAKDINGSVKQ
mgnify:FL=1